MLVDKVRLEMSGLETLVICVDDVCWGWLLVIGEVAGRMLLLLKLMMSVLGFL